MTRVLPDPTDISADFWDAAADHRLLVPRCNVTGTYFFPPERLCPETNTTDWAYVQSNGRGAVAASTVVFRSPSPKIEAPYVLAVIDLDEGWSMLTNVVDCDPNTVFIGMRVRATFLDCGDSRALPVFAPDESPMELFERG